MKLHPITGFTTSENRLWNDNSYDYNMEYHTDSNAVGYFSRLEGGFYQGFYKIPGYDYQVFPQREPLGWTAEFMLRYRWTGNTDLGLNKRYPNNKGTFFYLGARAENKFYHYPDGSPSQDTGYTRVTSGLTCMHTCECEQTGKTAEHSCIHVYQQSGGTSTNCSCGCPCNCSTTVKYPESDPTFDGMSNGLSLRLSGETGNPRLCVKTYRMTGGCETSGTCLTGLTYETGTTVSEWCSTRGIFDNCIKTPYVNVEHWVQIDAVFQRNEWFDPCDLNMKGGLGLIVETIFTATPANNSVSLIEPPITHDKNYDPATTEIVTFTDMWTEEQKYRLGTLKFYVNGKLFMVAENFEEIIPRLLNTPKEKQIGVGYNISIGGGTQGLHDNLTFSGGCPNTVNDIVYQQDPESLTTHDLDHTIYSGLTTHIKLEEIFGGSLIGDISAFRMYTEPLNASQVKHNFRILKNRYNLLDPDCPNCKVITPNNDINYLLLPCPDLIYLSLPCNDLGYEMYNCPTPTPTVTPTLTPTSEPLNLELFAEYSPGPGSIIASYTLLLNRSYSEEINVTFENLLDVYIGDPITIFTGVTVNAGSLSGQTIVTIDEDYNNYTGVPSFSQLSGTPDGSTWEIFVIPPTPTPTITPTNTETPTPTPSIGSTQNPTPTSTLTPTNTETPTPTPSIGSTQNPTPTNTPTPTITPSKPSFNKGPFTFDFDYMLCEFYFNDGADMDTVSYMTIPSIMETTSSDPNAIGPVNGKYYLYVGTCSYSDSGPQFPLSPSTPFLTYGGDNRGTGTESILFDLVEFVNQNPSTVNIEFAFTADWYGTSGTNPVTMRATLWKGGTPIYFGDPDYNWTNPTATGTYLVESNGTVITLNVQDCEPYELVSKLQYNINTKSGQFI